MDWVMACTKGKRVMRRESESEVCENEIEESTFLSILSFKVERNTIERLD